MKIFDDLYADAPSPSTSWRNLSKLERGELVGKVLLEMNESDSLEIEYCEDDGSVFVSFKKNYLANERGMVLLDFEWELKSKLDEALTVWHTPQGDKSSLRRLRGVEVKSS